MEPSFTKYMEGNADETKLSKPLKVRRRAAGAEAGRAGAAAIRVLGLSLPLSDLAGSMLLPSACRPSSSASGGGVAWRIRTRRPGRRAMPRCLRRSRC